RPSGRRTAASGAGGEEDYRGHHWLDGCWMLDVGFWLCPREARPMIHPSFIARGRIDCMRIVIILAFAFSLDAQITTTLNHLPGGLDEVRIRNNSATTLVASVVTGKRVAPLFRQQWGSLRNPSPTAEARFVVYSDPFVETASKPLLANEDRVLETAD